MKNTIHPIISSLAILLLMTISCRSTNQMSSTQSTTTTITTQSMDSLAKSILNTQKTTTNITYLPIQTPAFPKPAVPDVPEPVQDMINTLITHGGGTLIITHEEHLQNDTTTINHTTNETTAQNKSETNETHTQSNPPRASPIINKLFYLFLMSFILILLWESRDRQ